MPRPRKTEDTIEGSETLTTKEDSTRHPAEFNYKQSGRVIICPVCNQQARCDINRVPICPAAISGCPRGNK